MSIVLLDGMRKIMKKISQAILADPLEYYRAKFNWDGQVACFGEELRKETKLLE